MVGAWRVVCSGYATPKSFSGLLFSSSGAIKSSGLTPKRVLAHLWEENEF